MSAWRLEKENEQYATTTHKVTHHATTCCAGILQWELISREIPYSDKYTQPVQIAMAVVNRQERPTVPISIAAAIKAIPANRAETSLRTCDVEVQGGAQYLRLMRRCWSQGPAQRPTMAEIVAQLEALLRGL